MKKVLALLILALATLPSLADIQRIWPQYRIGAAELQDNDDRLTVSQAEGGVAYVANTSSLLTTCTVAVASIPAGQQFTRWWYYYLTGTGWSQVATTNTTALGTATTCTWTYDAKIATAGAAGVYVVADFDYLTYTLHYNANGGSGSMPDESHIYTNQFNLAANAFTRNGYTFGGWTNKTGTAFANQKQITSGAAFGVTYTNKTATLFAKWTANKYTVTLNQQNGSGGTSSVTATYGAAMPSITLPTRTGYTFGGYFTGTNGAGTQYYTAAGKSARAWDKTDATTLYAKWTAKTCTVTFDQQSGTGGSTSVTATYGSAMPTATMPTRTGYTFGGYFTEKNGTGTQYYTAAGASARAWDIASATTLYAKWTANTYAVHFNVNGGTGTMSNQSFTYDVAQALTANAFTRTGYRFVGWATNATSTAIYEDKASVSNLTATANATVNLYAKWTANTYTVTLDPGEGTVDPTSVAVTYQGAWPILPEPTREGYYFNGWFNDSASQTATPTNTAVALTSDTTIYAKWTQRLTATFIDPLNLTTQTVDVASGSTPVAPFTPSYNGYTFTGWSPALRNITQDTTYTAQFTGTQYFITYHSNFGIPEETRKINYVYGTAKAAPDGATLFPRVGYTFQGWATSAELTAVRFRAGEGIVTFSDEGNDLYAVWEPITYTIHFDANGGTGEMTDIADVKYDTEVTLPACAFTKSGVEFTNWKCSTETYGDGATVSNLTTTANAIVTFFAVWSEPRYIAFDGNGADDAEAMIDDVLTFDGIETHALVSNKFEKTGYTFGGWATNEMEAAALHATYADGADVVSTNLWRAIGETNVFYAVWSNNHYTVHFDANGGTGTMADMALTYDVETNLASCTFTHASGLSFAGWTNYTDSVGYDDGATVSNLTAEADGTVTLSAVWDVGVLSKAMHCNNLEWTSEDSWGSFAGWTTAEGDGIGYDSNSAAVSVLTDEDRTQLLTAKVTTGGTLSFKFKVVGDANITWTNANSSVTYSGLNAGTWYSETLEIAAPVEGKTKEIFLQYVLSKDAADTVRVYIDQMTWVPAGSTVEPTEADRPVVSGFTPATTGGFTLSVDHANISDSFSYQILATNELVSGAWPVKETLTADDLKAGYAITPEADAPTMFYKVKVIAK